MTEAISGITAHQNMRGRHFDRRMLIIVVVMLVLFWGLLLIGQAWHNALERDEGYLNAAAYLVSIGFTPYVDFIFPQQPYYPLIYGLWYKLTAVSLLGSRYLSIFFYGCLVAAMAVSMVALRKDKDQAFWAAIFLAFNTLCLFWYPRAKHYVSADLFLYIAFWLSVQTAAGLHSNRKVPVWWALAAGACAAIAIQIRLLLAPALPVLACAIVWKKWRGGGRGHLGWFCLGLIIASLPNAAIFCQSPAAWFFNNFEMHLATRPEIEPGVAIRSMGTAVWGFVRRFENSLLIAFALGGLILPGRAPRVTIGERLALGVIIALSAGFLIPQPTYRQYWVEVMPYLVVASVGPWCRFLDQCNQRLSHKKYLAAGILLVIVMAGGYKAVGRVVVSQHWHPVWGMGHYLRFNAYMQTKEQSDPQSLMLTWWPGYLVAHGIRPYPGSELGKPCYRAVNRLSRKQMITHGMLHPDDVRHIVAAGKPDLVLLGPDSGPDDARDLSSTYALQAEFGSNRLYKRK